MPNNSELAFKRPFAEGPIVVPAVTPMFEDPNYDGWPVLYHAVAVIPPTGEVTPATMNLINKEKRLVEINEIRFDILKPTATSGVTSPMSVMVKLALGKLKITRDFVPIGLFNRRVSNYESLKTTGQAVSNAVTSVVWRMPVAIPLDPGAVLVPTFKGSALTNEPLTVLITYIGRTTTRPLGDRVRFPFVGAYLGTPSVAGSFVDPGDVVITTTDIVSSDEQSLINNTGLDLRLNYLTGRLMATQFTATGSQAVDADGQAVYDEADPYYDPTVVCRLITSQGYELVKDFTPYNLVFGQERAFDCELILPPQQFITVETQFNPLANITPASPFPWEQIFLQVGMVGSYVVDLGNLPADGEE